MDNITELLKVDYLIYLLDVASTLCQTRERIGNRNSSEENIERGNQRKRGGKKGKTAPRKTRKKELAIPRKVIFKRSECFAIPLLAGRVPTRPVASRPVLSRAWSLANRMGVRDVPGNGGTKRETDPREKEEKKREGGGKNRTCNRGRS